MIDVTYGIVEEKYTVGEVNRISYGIAGYANVSERDIADVVVCVHDVTSDKERLSELVLKCNELGLSQIHLRDVVEDFLLG